MFRANDSFNAAQIRSRPKPLSDRNIGTLSTASFRGRISSSQDSYRFKIDQPSQLQLSLRGLAANLDVRLFNSRGALVKASAKPGIMADSLNTPLASGTYTLRVYPASRGQNSRYRLSLSATPSAFAPEIVLTKLVGGFKQPVFITRATGSKSSDRLFVVEQSGTIQIIQKGKKLAAPFLDIGDRISNSGEQGLLSAAFPANYARKKQFYVYYTNTAGDIIISRFGLTSASVANPDSEQVILTIPHPGNQNHNGGQIAFGKDGYLYIGTGDGGGGGDPANNAQNPGSLLGKLLRIDVATLAASYRIPTSNPFVAANDVGDRFRDEIWALGLRNPWRFSFDRQTGDLYIGDVGQNAYEEINFQPARSAGGQNYGWNIREGNHPFNHSTATLGLVSPVAEYEHSQGSSVTGGFVYRGIANPQLQGLYFYGDFTNGTIWGLRNTATGWQNKRLLNSAYNISTFGEDERGNLYVADYSQGDIYKITQTQT